jgi:hypothetical protein
MSPVSFVPAAGRDRAFLSVDVGPPSYRKHLRTLADVLSTALSGRSFVIAGDLNAARHVDAVYGGKWFTRYFADIERCGLHDCHWALHERERPRFWGHQAKNPISVTTRSSMRPRPRPVEVRRRRQHIDQAPSDHGPIQIVGAAGPAPVAIHRARLWTSTRPRALAASRTDPPGITTRQDDIAVGQAVSLAPWPGLARAHPFLNASTLELRDCAEDVHLEPAGGHRTRGLSGESMGYNVPGSC